MNDVGLLIANYMLMIVFNAIINKELVPIKVDVHFYRHRYTLSLSFLRPTFYHVSATSHVQSAGPRRQAGLRSGALCLVV